MANPTGISNFLKTLISAEYKDIDAVGGSNSAIPTATPWP
jgi:hypothetical protein